MTALLHRRGQRALDGPAALQSIQQGMRTASEDSRPFRHIARFAVECQSMMAARVVRLLQSCRPSHVIRLVIAIVVDAFDRVVRRRPMADMFQKGWKVVAPQRMDRYASAAVVLERLRLLVVAAFVHAAPYVVFGRVFQAVGASPIADIFTSPAAATFGAMKAAYFDVFFNTAFAATQPQARVGFRTSQHGQASVNSAGAVFSWRHAHIIHGGVS
jgi:hypothetical protein